jgi:hypothetical protein
MPMAVATPDWLAQHKGAVREGVHESWLVIFDSAPQYRLVPRPAAGKYSCEVMQTINGKRLDRGGTFPSVEDAVRGGLEDLRVALGW